MKQIKRVLSLALLLSLLVSPMAMATGEASDQTAYDEYEVPGFDTTYLEQMWQAAQDGSPAALAEGAVAQENWNQKILTEALSFTPANFFGVYENPLELAVLLADYIVDAGFSQLAGQPLQYRIIASSKNLRMGPGREYERVSAFPHGTIVTYLGSQVNGWIRVTNGTYVGWCSAIHLAPFDGNPVPVLNVTSPGAAAGGQAILNPVVPIEHTDDDLFWLALTIEMEAGSAWLTDEHQLLVGNVVLNRVASDRFPNTIRGVVHDPGQYAFMMSGARRPISDRAWANAQRLLDGERFAPEDVVFQAEFRQGSGVFMTIHCERLGTTTFFSHL